MMKNNLVIIDSPHIPVLDGAVRQVFDNYIPWKLFINHHGYKR
ncbi:MULTISPECIES: hypothetical protein [unclassified Sphingobacterium]|nr:MULTISPECIES: hypothetical protein [unclassified Sphingobacterium]